MDGSMVHGRVADFDHHDPEVVRSRQFQSSR